MSRSSDTLALGMLALLAAGSGCSRTAPASLSFRVGHHAVRCVPPAGWERLDHGRQQVFRRGEMVIFVADLGPASRPGLESELSAARRIAEAGRVEDAFERVRQLEGPPLFLASQQLRADFWRAWNGVVLSGEQTPLPAVESGLDSLVAGAARLPNATPEEMATYALHRTTRTSRREVAHEVRRTVGGAEWVVVDTWNQVTHLDRTRLACLDDGGYLLALGIERGPIEHAGPVFDALLGSLEVAPGDSLVTQGAPPR